MLNLTKEQLDQYIDELANLKAQISAANKRKAFLIALLEEADING